MMSKRPKLIYFDCKGRGELSRLVFAAAEKPYEDVRLPYPYTKEWLEDIKPKTPFGKIPVLEIDGEYYSQGISIATYLAKEYGLDGKNNLEALKIDSVVQLSQEIFPWIEHAMYNLDKEEEIKSEVLKKRVPRYLNVFESVLSKNGSGFFVGDSMTLADLAVFDLLTGYFKYLGVEIDTNNNPKIVEFIDKMMSIERIGNYVKNRRDCGY